VLGTVYKLFTRRVSITTTYLYCPFHFEKKHNISIFFSKNSNIVVIRFDSLVIIDHFRFLNDNADNLKIIIILRVTTVSLLLSIILIIYLYHRYLYNHNILQ